MRKLVISLSMACAIVLVLALGPARPILSAVPSRTLGSGPTTGETGSPNTGVIYLPHISASGDRSAEPTAQPTTMPTVAATSAPTGTPTATPIATATATPIETPTGSPEGELDNNGLFHGLNGVELGALAASLAEPITVTLGITTAPPEAMPSGILPRGSYFQIAVDRDITTSLAEPLLIGFPVPQEADPAHLALAVLDDQEPFTTTAQLAWYFLDGLYDADQGLFLTTLSALKAAGNVYVLAEHYSFDSPANDSELQDAGTTVGAFTVSCRAFPESDDCLPATEEQVAIYLDQIHTRMTNDFGFPAVPRLQSPLGRIVMAEDQNSLAYVSGFTASITPHSYFRCENAGGIYRPDRGLLYLCYDPAEGITAYTPNVLIHEYFHAVQYSYAKVFDPDSEDPPPPPEAWIIEGMATMAMESYYLDDTVVRSTEQEWQKPLLKIDESPRHAIWGDEPLNEYYAQDFWVYMGQRFLEDLGYVDQILEEGGATTEGVALALAAKFNVPFDELFWGFVKNQAIENLYSLGDNEGILCTANYGALGGLHIVWPYDPVDYWEYPNPSGELYDSIDPLTAKLIEITFPAEVGRAYMAVELEVCQGLPSDQKETCQLQAQKDLHSKIYVSGEMNCQAYTDAVEGKRTFTVGSVPGERYYILLANADIHFPHSYYILVEHSLKPR